MSTVRGSVVDARTGEPETSATVALYPKGGGEFLAELDAHGYFEFRELAEGEYQLGVYGPRHVSQNMPIVVRGDDSVEEVTVTLVPWRVP